MKPRDTHIIKIERSEKMTHGELLREKYISPTGCTISHLAKLLGCSRPTAYVLLDNPVRCTWEQADALIRAFKIEEADWEKIFKK